MGQLRVRHLVAVLVVALAAGRPASAAPADWPVPRGPSREPVPYEFKPDHLKQLPKEYLEETSACLVYSGTSHRVEADGTVETTTHEVIRFNGRKAIEKLGEYRKISYDPAYEKLTLNEAHIHKADGKVVEVQARDVHLRDLNTDYEIYSQGKQLVISFPNLEVGDVIEVKWTQRGRDPEDQGYFFTRYSFGDVDYPIGRDEFWVRVPKKMTFKHGAAGELAPPTVTEDQDGRLYHWKVTNRREVPRDEDMPADDDLRPRVVCSTFASWDEVGKWNYALLKNCWECDAELRKIVADVTRGLATPLEKARALTYWFRRHVRYLAIGENHGFTPHPPAVVLGNRYGDCKDGSQLLAVMLHQAGVQVGLVSLTTKGDGQMMPEVPSPMANHAILVVTIDGRAHWIDSVYSRAAWDYLPPGDADRVCYVQEVADLLAGKPALRLTRTPPARPEDNVIEETTRVTIQTGGTIVCERSGTYRGGAAVAQREAWLEEPAGERRRHVSSELERQWRGQVRLRKFQVDEAALRDLDQPVTATTVFEIADYFEGEGLRSGAFSLQRLRARLLITEAGLDRELPLDLGEPFLLRQRYEFELPPTLVLADTPADQTVRSPWGLVTVACHKVKDQPRKLVLEFHARLEKGRVEPKEFAAFRKFQEDAQEAYRRSLELKPETALASAEALEKYVVEHPQDGAAVVLLAKLYQGHQRYADARRVAQQGLKANARAEGLAEVLLEVARAVEQQAATDRAEGHLHLAKQALARGDAKDALDNWTKADRADHAALDNAEALRVKGQILEELDRFGLALSAYQQALKHKGTDLASLTGAARLLIKAKKNREALDYVLRATVAAGNDAEDLAAVADLHFQLNRLDDARHLAERALEAGAAPAAEKTLGMVLWKQGDVAKALPHLEKAGAEQLLAEAYLAAGRLGDAVRLNGKGLPPEPLQALLNRKLALRAQLASGPDAGAAAEAALDRCVCAEEALKRQRPAGEVEALANAALKDGVELGPAYALRGQMVLERGRLAQALADAEKAVALSPGEFRGWLVRGRVRLERGQLDGAIADLGQAADLTKRKEPAVLSALAAALFQAHQREAALAAQKAAVELRPQDTALQEQLRTIQESR